MEAKTSDAEARVEEQLEAPLLDPKSSDDRDERTAIMHIISQTLKSTAHLANLLPTGTVLAFQLLSPIFTNQGRCRPVNRAMTACLVALCGLSCFVLSFSDSFRNGAGKVRHGFATFRGLWIIDGTTTLSPEEAATYRIRLLDFVHGFLSVLVFAAVALFDQRIMSCFYPNRSDAVNQVLMVMPVAIGIISSWLFVTFPTTRHGIGFSLAPHRLL